MTLPSWLADVQTPSPARLALIESITKSWVTLAPHVTKLTDEECLYILKLEVQKAEPRPEFVSRMFSRASREQRDKRWTELMQLTKDRGYRNHKGKKRSA